MIQFLRQSNTNYELSAVRIYQAIVVFIHAFNPTEQILKSFMHLFYWKLKDKKLGSCEKEYLHYLMGCLVKKINKKGKIGYLPIKYQIMALMCMRQISVPVFLSTGNSIFVYVESFNSFQDIKSQCLEQFGISKRISS